MPRTDLPAAAGPPPGLTAAQAHILAAQSADPSYAGHNVGQYIELVGALDTVALDEAVLRTLDEAPWLRSRLMTRGGLPRLDTSAAADPVGAAVELVRGRLACPPRPELLTAPAGTGLAPDLTGALLVTVGPRRHLLVQYFHLPAVDGYGVALLSRRIAEVYTALVHGRPPGPTPSHTSPYWPTRTAPTRARRRRPRTGGTGRGGTPTAPPPCPPQGGWRPPRTPRGGTPCTWARRTARPYAPPPAPRASPGPRSCSPRPRCG